MIDRDTPNAPGSHYKGVNWGRIGQEQANPDTILRLNEATTSHPNYRTWLEQKLTDLPTANDRILYLEGELWHAKENAWRLCGEVAVLQETIFELTKAKEQK